jgi:transposase
MSYDDAGTSGVQRFEIFTGSGRRRDWPRNVKVSIVAESFSGAETVCAVARRHGLCPSQLFTWRRELRMQQEDQELMVPVATPRAPSFVPAVVEPAADAPPAVKRPRRRRRTSASAIELEIDGVAVKIGSGADASIITAVIEALKATR